MREVETSRAISSSNFRRFAGDLIPATSKRAGDVSKAIDVTDHDEARPFTWGFCWWCWCFRSFSFRSASDRVNRIGVLQHLIARTKFFQLGARLDTQKRAA
jgi:hypothetical protein